MSYLILGLCAWLSAHAQQPSDRNSAKPLSYGFISPNTHEGLKLEDAIRNLTSPEEENLIRQARSLSCVAQSEIGTVKAVGSWSDGAEHSVLLRIRTDEQTLRYMLAVLGRAAEQKAVLYFRPRRGGPAVIYSLHQQRRFSSLTNVAGVLDQSGVEYRTLVPTKKSVVIYIVDTMRNLRAKVMAAARKLRARVMAQRGSAEFIGDDSDRERARMIFNKEINAYEATHYALLTKCQKHQTIP